MLCSPSCSHPLGLAASIGQLKWEDQTRPRLFPIRAMGQDSRGLLEGADRGKVERGDASG